MEHVVASNLRNALMARGYDGAPPDDPVSDAHVSDLFPPEGLEVFVLTTGQDVHANTLSGYLAGQRVWTWTVQSTAKRGDLFLLYVAKPVHAFAWIGRLRSDAERPEGEKGDRTAWVEMRPLAEPLGLEATRDLPDLAGSSLMQPRGLQRSSRRVEPHAWSALLSAVSDRDPTVVAALREWQTPGAAIEESSWFVWDAARAGIDYPFLKEHQLQARVKEMLELGEGMREPKPEDGLDLRGLEARLGPRNRADIILVDETHEPPRLVVVETKLFARDVAGLDQLVRYREWLIEHRPDWQLDLVLAAQVIGPEVRARAREAEVSCVEVRWGEEEDEFLPGDGELTLDWSEPEHEIVFDEVEMARRTRVALDVLEDSTRRTALPDARTAEDASDGPGVIAFWIDPDDADGLDDLGVPTIEPDRPLLVVSCLHLPEAIESLGAPEGFPSMLLYHLTLVRHLAPRPIYSGSHSDDAARQELASWSDAHITASWTATPGLIPSGVTRQARRVLKPLFSGYAVVTVDELVSRFGGNVALNVDRSLWSTAWEDWMLSGLTARDDGGHADGLRVAVDAALQPVALESELSAEELDGLSVAILDASLWTDGARLLKERPPRDRLSDNGQVPKNWSAMVDLLDPEAIPALLVGEEIRGLGVRVADRSIAIAPTAPGRRRLIHLPGSSPLRGEEYAVVSRDGSRMIQGT